MQLIYFADPMCSWCWGFAPVMSRLLETYSDRITPHLVMGGLRAGNTTPMDDTQRDYIRKHWRHVEKRSGQPFDFAFFDRDNFIYDTEPACRAVVTVRNLDASRTYPVMSAIQRAFYADGEDVTNPDVLAELASMAGIAPGRFHQAFDSDDAREMTARDFQTAQQIGVPGFPTLLIGDDGAALTVLANGYQEYDGIAQRLDSILAPAGAANPAPAGAAPDSTTSC